MIAILARCLLSRKLFYCLFPFFASFSHAGILHFQVFLHGFALLLGWEKKPNLRQFSFKLIFFIDIVRTYIRLQVDFSNTVLQILNKTSNTTKPCTFAFGRVLRTAAIPNHRLISPV